MPPPLPGQENTRSVGECGCSSVASLCCLHADRLPRPKNKSTRNDSHTLAWQKLKKQGNHSFRNCIRIVPWACSCESVAQCKQLPMIWCDLVPVLDRDCKPHRAMNVATHPVFGQICDQIWHQIMPWIPMLGSARADTVRYHTAAHKKG